MIVVNYNGLQHLDTCLESLSRQTCAGCEIIVVDNGSTDGTRELLAKLEEESAEIHSCRVTFAAVHLNAWMSAINEARLILGELFDVTEQDMNREDLDLENPKQFAVLKIGALGWLLGHLIAFATGEASADDAPATDQTDMTP